MVQDIVLGIVVASECLSGVFYRNYIQSWKDNEIHLVCLQQGEDGQKATSTQITVEGKTYDTDEWMNAPSSILSSISRRLHLQPDHPITITRKLIESRFPAPTYQKHNTLFPIVSVAQNFDSLGFPTDHVGRSRNDTYYINKSTVLRTHTSAHQADTFRANTSEGFLISADVYRRDAIDRSHYPIFHQMEGARTWSRSAVPEGTTLAQQVWDDLKTIPKHDLVVEDPNPSFHPDRNPLQSDRHSPEEAEAVATHLKRSLEDVVVTIFSAARAAAAGGFSAPPSEPLKVRWVEAYFPFTSPSWELEVFWQNDWLEVLGCGVVRQRLLDSVGVPDRVGWAFGIGLERIAMLLFEIPDIRLFWSRDPRFLDQFRERVDGNITRFKEFSKYPPAPRDVAFWLPKSTAAASTPDSRNEPHSAPNPAGGLAPESASNAPASSTTTNSPSASVSSTSAPPPSTASSSTAATTHPPFHENDLTELVRATAGDLAESVTLIDAFAHPKTGRQSRCYRIVYRSLERTLTSEEVAGLHERIGRELVARWGVELR
ncbi:phenylalanyl-tRNA synthetase alpha subunit, mitochondrial [Cryomyces antarcticus]|nr:phenylalanyl-tRNA synthetase alpha subunit, mitochondrial [Cryomyces antarcticus]